MHERHGSPPPPRPPLRWLLEIDADSRPIQGHVSDGQGQVRSFSSWVALLAALESLRSEAAGAGERPA